MIALGSWLLSAATWSSDDAEVLCFASYGSTDNGRGRPSFDGLLFFVMFWGRPLSSLVTPEY